jgi:dienelactone hydrolase
MEVIAGAHHGFDQFTNRGRPLGTRRELNYTLAPNRAATDTARTLVKEFLSQNQ